MGNKSKIKGKNFERQICSILSKVFGSNFQRVPNSGAFVGGLNASRYQSLTNEQKLLADGDVIVPSFLSHFSIECKSYQDFAFHSLYSGKNKLLDEWIKQASSTQKPHWLLFFKINNKGVYVVYDFLLLPKTDNSDNKMIYKNKYIIEEAESFLSNNKDYLISP
jgi:hypothetical protein